MNNPLDDIIPAGARRAVYAVIALLALAWTCWEAAHGDWLVAVGSFIVALSHATAASNTRPVAQTTVRVSQDLIDRTIASIKPPRKMGRLPHDPSKPRLRLALPDGSDAVPASVDWLSEVPSFPMYLNDRIGDCTCAAAAHLIQAWTRYAGKEHTIRDASVLKLYKLVSGYDPHTGANDNGARMQDVLAAWRKVGLGGRKILGFAQIDHANMAQVRAAIAAFGGLYVGVNFPDSAMVQFDNRKPWTVVKGARIEGGHAIHVGAYDNNTLNAVTWGAVQGMDERWWSAYVEEAWVVVTADWLAANGSTPAGQAVAALGAEFTALTGEPSPFAQAA